MKLKKYKKGIHFEPHYSVEKYENDPLSFLYSLLFTFFEKTAKILTLKLSHSKRHLVVLSVLTGIFLSFEMNRLRLSFWLKDLFKDRLFRLTKTFFVFLFFVFSALRIFSFFSMSLSSQLLWLVDSQNCHWEDVSEERYDQSLAWSQKSTKLKKEMTE